MENYMIITKNGNYITPAASTYLDEENNRLFVYNDDDMLIGYFSEVLAFYKYDIAADLEAAARKAGAPAAGSKILKVGDVIECADKEQNE